MGEQKTKQGSNIFIGFLVLLSLFGVGILGAAGWWVSGEQGKLKVKVVDVDKRLTESVTKLTHRVVALENKKPEVIEMPVVEAAPQVDNTAGLNKLRSSINALVKRVTSLESGLKAQKSSLSQQVVRIDSNVNRTGSAMDQLAEQRKMIVALQAALKAKQAETTQAQKIQAQLNKLNRDVKQIYQLMEDNY